MEQKAPSTGTSKSVLITAVILAVVAVVIVNVYINTMKNRQREGYLQVVEAKRQFARGRVLTKDDVSIVEMAPVSESAARKLVKESQLAGLLAGQQPLIRPVDKNDRLEWTHFAPDAADPGFNLVEKGTRGITLPVDPKTSPGPLLRQGAYVDILATIPPDSGSDKGARTVTLMEHVLVVAVGGRTSLDTPDPRANYSSVTLQVKPADAEKLATINAHLRYGVTLVLRHIGEPAAPGSEKRLDEAMQRLGLTPGGRPGG